MPDTSLTKRLHIVNELRYNASLWSGPKKRVAQGRRVPQSAVNFIEKLSKGSIEKKLAELSYQSSDISVPNWELYTREEDQDFAALYTQSGDFEDLLVTGPISNERSLESDLTVIDKKIIHEPLWSRTVRNKRLYEIAMFISGGGAGASAFVATQGNLYALLGGFFVGGAVGALGIRAIQSKIDNRYALRLSEDAENYSYGNGAVSLLEKELNFRGIKSGEISKERYLHPV